ncbi:hypothetical protein PI124_g20730 [Phytophthora idaei]|nr:hypothetical protein PI125_g20952 [Phytophthora idaei]KAG3134849.1 hypothetical protein PI126_g18519 [Phytophthora idaei]KAG3234213.1 hypothetical protein PI124_g20730 [Phytophthora idaei]
MYFEGCDTTSGFFMPACAAHIRTCLDEEKVRYVFLPGNIDTNRMICLVIALYAKKIHVYERTKSNKITKMMVGLANGQGAKGPVHEANDQDANSEG